MDKLKIAVVFSGNPRNFMDEYNRTWIYFFQRLANLGNCDIFFHSWTNEKRVIREGIYEDKPYLHFDAIKKVLSPKLFKIEEESVFETLYRNEFASFPVYLLRPQAAKKHILAQLYSIYQADLLRRQYEETNKFKYDCVIKLRFDMRLDFFDDREIFLFKTYPEYQNMILTPNPKAHPHPGGSSCKRCMDANTTYHRYYAKKQIMFNTHTDEHDSDLCDIYAIGSSDSMTQYANAFLNCKSLYAPLYAETKRKLQYHNNAVQESCPVESCDTRLTIRPWKLIETDFNCFYPEKIQRHNLKNLMVLPANTVFKVVRY